MGVCATLFFNPADQLHTVDYRIRPSDDQYSKQQDRWNDLRDVLLVELKARTGLNISSWLQGSYKYGTQIRPVGPDQEFDIDLGIYFEWSGSAVSGAWRPKELKDLIQTVLVEYAQSAENDSEGVDDPKQRCARIHFSDDFHIDVPCYHLDRERDERSLATESDDWESSDPKAIYKWWKDEFDEPTRARVRRIVRYLKMWAMLAFKDSVAPTSVTLTVLAAEATKALDIASISGDDEFLTSVAIQIYDRLTLGYEVPNPIDAAENLNRLSDKENEKFHQKIGEFANIGGRALGATTRTEGAAIWAEAFFQFIVVPPLDQKTLAKSANGLPIVAFIPEVDVTATSDALPRRVWNGRNQIGPIPKNCSLNFSLANWNELPAGSEVSWTVRNAGKDAEGLNDLGHQSASGLECIERSAYTGRHSMDIQVKLHGRLIGFRSVSVVINSIGIAPRNPKRKPPYPGYSSRR